MTKKLYHFILAPGETTKIRMLPSGTDMLVHWRRHIIGEQCENSADCPVCANGILPVVEKHLHPIFKNGSYKIIICDANNCPICTVVKTLQPSWWRRWLAAIKLGVLRFMRWLFRKGI